MTNELKKGYKQTDVGIIPEDWEVRKLFEVANFENGKAHENFIDDMGKYIVVNSKFISTESEVCKHSNKNLSPLKIGDIAMVMSDIPNGKALAKCYLVEQNNLYTLNQRICSIQATKANNEFLFRLLNRNKYFLEFDSGSGQTNLRKVEVLDCPLPVPPLAEQQAIAEVLSDVDTLVTSLDALLTKKRNIKQGTMQLLLTGKKRLPGFSGDWETKTFAEVFEFLLTGSNSRSELSKYGEIKYIHYGDIHTKWRLFLDCQKEIIPYIKKEKVKSLPQLKDGDLVLVDASEDYEGLSFGVEVKNIGENKLVAGLHTLLLRGNKNLVADGFKGYITSIKSVHNEMKKIATGISVYGISKNNLKSVPILLPTIEEQKAIAQILSEMDAEIEALEIERDKYKALKQGVMQELLTGKTRLV